MYFSIWTVDIGWSFLFLFPKNTGNVVEVDVKKYFLMKAERKAVFWKRARGMG